MRDATPHLVYRLTDATGFVYYVGCTRVGSSRADHWKQALPPLTFDVVDVFDDKPTARDREAELISGLKPPLNIASLDARLINRDVFLSTAFLRAWRKLPRGERGRLARLFSKRPCAVSQVINGHVRARLSHWLPVFEAMSQEMGLDKLDFPTGQLVV